MPKYLITLFLPLVMLSTASFKTQEPKQVTFEKTEHNFGTVGRGKGLAYTFRFEVTGDKPASILSVHPNCSCTVPTYTKEPVQPGKQGEVKIEYETASLGEFDKTVGVVFEEEIVVLRIKGNVSEEGSK